LCNLLEGRASKSRRLSGHFNLVGFNRRSCGMPVALVVSEENANDLD
jgi:hypothetical protein